MTDSCCLPTSGPKHCRDFRSHLPWRKDIRQETLEPQRPQKPCPQESSISSDERVSMFHFVSSAEACDWLKKSGGRGITSWYIITSLTSAYQGGQAPSPSGISQLHVLQCLGDFSSVSPPPLHPGGRGESQVFQPVWPAGDDRLFGLEWGVLVYLEDAL